MFVRDHASREGWRIYADLNHALLAFPGTLGAQEKACQSGFACSAREPKSTQCLLNPELDLKEGKKRQSGN